MNRPLIIGISLVIAAWASLEIVGHYSQRKAAQGIAQANQHQQQAIADAAQGIVHDQDVAKQAEQVQQLNQSLTSDQTEIKRLTAQRDALLAKLHSSPVQPTTPSGPSDPGPAKQDDDPATLLAADAELIQAQAKTIQDQVVAIQARDTLIASLTASRDSWHSAYDQSQQEAAAQRIALEAQASAIRAGRWKGRIEGFLIGIGTGYVAGKL